MAGLEERVLASGAGSADCIGTMASLRISTLSHQTHTIERSTAGYASED